MLNNEFRLIGTVVSEYEKFGSENFPKYSLNIEVEKRKKGQTATYKVIVYEKNFAVDVTKSVIGKQVIVSGYIDAFRDTNQLIMQDMVIVGEVAAVAPTKEVVETPVDNIAVELPDEDDDLPF